MTIHTKAPQSIDEKIDRILGLGGGVVGGTEVIISIDVYNKRVEKIKELFRAEITTTDMEVSEIEERVEEFERQMPLMRAHGKLLCATASPTTYKKLKDWLRQALTEAYQAGIDEAVEKMKKNYIEPIPEANGSDIDDYMRGYNQALDDTIKALQDNK